MNAFLGALIAAILTGLTAALVLLSGDTVTSLASITPLQWVILAIGVAIAFFKDLQAISARRLINKVTKTGDGGGTI